MSAADPPPPEAAPAPASSPAPAPAPVPAPADVATPWRPGRSRWLRRLAWAAGTLAVLALLWTAVIGWWLPGWLRPRLETAATQALGTPVRVGQLTVQPWTLQVAMAAVGIGPAEAPLFTAAGAQARLSLRSVRYLAPVISGFTLQQPQLVIERQGRDRFNFSPVLDHLRAQPAAPADSAPVRFALYNIRVQDGRITYTDRVLDQRHQVEALQIGVPFVSNLPDDIDAEVQPLLQARLDGSPVRLTGHARPFAPGRPTTLQLDWRDVPLHDWADAVRPLLPPQARIDLAQGRLDTALTLTFQQRPSPAVPLLRLQGRLGLRQVDARWPQGGVAWRWDALTLEGLDAAPLERRAALDRIDLAGLTVTQGQATPVADPVPAAAPASAPPVSVSASASAPATPASTAAAPAWAWSVKQVRVAAPRVALRGAAAAPPPVLGPLTLALDGLNSAAAATPAQLLLQAADASGARLRAQGTVRAAVTLPADAERARLALTLDDLAMVPWLRALSLPLPLQVNAGTLSAQATLRLDDAQLAVSEGAVRLAGLQAGAIAAAAPGTATALAGRRGRVAAPVTAAASAAGAAAVSAAASPSAGRATPAPADRLNAGRIEATGLRAQVRLPGSPQGAGLASMQLAGVAVTQLDLGLRRDARGRFTLFTPAPAQAADAAAPARAASSAAMPASAPAAAGAPPGPAWSIDAVRCSQCAVAFVDEATQPALQVALSQADLTVGQVSADLGRTLPVTLRTLAQGRGEVRFQGTVRPQPLAIDARVALKDLDLKALQPVLDPQVNLTLMAAQAQADGQLTLAAAAQGVDVRYRGRAGLTDVRTQDTITRNDFVRWRGLALEGADVAWQRGALNADLGQVALSDFFGRIIVHPDGHLNLQDVRRNVDQARRSLTTPQPAGAASAPRSATPPPTVAPLPAPAASGPPMKLRWQGIKLAQGRVDFTDNFVRPNYSARLNRLQGDISALSTESTEPARIELSGALDDGAPLRVTGRMNPLGPRLYTEIEGTAQGIELTRLSTYAERYAGYAIEKGSLSVTVNYKIQDGQLQAQNRLFLDQLTFGAKVDSPTATKLPVQLAVSLLKNSRGEIDINLPVAGSLDDPQFSVGGVLLRLIGNLLLKAVTSPFALLTGAAQALAGGDAGELGYVPFEPGAAQLSDTARQRLDELAARLKERPTLKLEATGRADPAVDAEGLRQRHLERLLRTAKARETGAARGTAVTIAPEERNRWLEAAYKAADLRKPRNLIGLARQIPPEQMEALLKGDVDTSDAALYTLANRRVDAVSAYLADKLGADRVLVTRSVLGTQGLAKDQGPSSRVQFELR